ncbi:MAG TPA: hypothetical protein PKW33_06655 [Anaerolineaceae bacterium]|nr:hypothetical protein [Anaerolineaceae bacterium]HPN51249.1 hypothetical protein [Anaerolineaceae bacterium]
MSVEAIEIGRLLRGSTRGFVAGCRVSQLDVPAFGSLVRAPLQAGYQVFGLIYDMRIDDDGMVRQLAVTDEVPDYVVHDNRLNRNVPVELSVLAVGYELGGKISHMLPPRPPLCLDLIYLCSPQEICAFTNHGRFGYLRHLLQNKDVPLGELAAAHFQQTGAAQASCGKADWLTRATAELIVLLRDDYPTLMGVLGALSELNTEA